MDVFAPILAFIIGLGGTFGIAKMIVPVLDLRDDNRKIDRIWYGW